MATTSGISASPIGPTSGGKVYAFNNLTTSPQVVAPADQYRTQITFDNPGTVDIFVAPSLVQANNSIPAGGITNSTLTPTTSALGGCYRIYANGGTRTFAGECQGQWQAFAASATGNPLTVTDSHV